MSESLSLFKEVQSGGYQACLATTFTLDFGFYEEVLLRRMRAKGVRHHFLMVDERMASQALMARPPEKIGLQYTLTTMRTPQAFHPKVLLLLGEKKGLLAVGSHNFTLSGFGLNLEVTSVLRFDKTDTSQLALFQAAFNAMRTWMLDYGGHLPSQVTDVLEKTQNLCPWLESVSDEVSEAALLYSSTSTESLWDQAINRMPGPLDRVMALAPFFDRQLTFVGELAKVSRQSPLLAIEPDRVQAPGLLVDDDRFDLRDLRGFNPRSGEKGDTAEHYRHAKVLLFEGEQGSVLIAGSANLSSPAWLAPPSVRNVEAVLMLRGEFASAGVLALGLDSIHALPPVTEIESPTYETEKATESEGVIVVVPAPEQGDWLELPRPAGEGSASVWYETVGLKNEIPFVERGTTLLIARDQLQQGKILNIGLSGRPAQRIVLHYSRTLRANTLSGAEQRLRQALDGLQTNDVDMSLLFRCLDKLMFSEKETAPSHLSGNAKVQVCVFRRT